MNILFINEKCGWQGGAEQYIADTSLGLQELGHKCWLAYDQQAKQNPASYADLFKGCFEIQMSGETEQSKKTDRIEDIVQKVKPDVLYFHRIPSMAPFQNVVEQVRSVRMIHDHDLCCPRKHKYYCVGGKICTKPAGWRCWIDCAFLERKADSSGFQTVNICEKIRDMRRNLSHDRLLVGSRHMKHELKYNGFDEQRIVIVPPVIRQTGSRALKLPQLANVLFVGQLVRGKGVDLLLEALALVGGEWSATIIGEGNMRAQLELQSEHLGLADRVTFTGWVDHESIHQHYASASVVAVPSRWPEPFGIIGLEAMFHRRPVVGFDVGGIPDWLENNTNGFLVPPTDVGKFSHALEVLLVDSERATSLGLNGLAKLKSEFSFEKHLGQVDRCLSPDCVEPRP